MTSISLEDRECRFVLEHPVLGRFSKLLSRLDIRLPAELPLDDMVRWGWLIPDLRLPLSASFVRSWKHFATYGLDRTICSEDAPLDLAWYRAATLLPEVPGSTCTGVWWEHPFECPSYPAGWATPLEPFVRNCKIPAGAGSHEPQPVHDASSHEVQGWVDFYQGWQAFQVHDLMRAARLHAPLLNTPDAPARATNLSQRIDDFRRLSNGWIERVGRDWAARRTAFEHLYRYRTLLGIWMGREGTLRQRQGGARQLARQLGLDAPSLKNEIRDVLLVAWKDLSELPASARERLRSDINIAVEWLSVLEGRPVDTFDEFWDPADPNPREWERLPEVLPFELDAARHEFGRRTTHYLQRFNSYMPAPRRYDEARISLLIQRHWIKSLSVRRFCLAFLRLHKHYGGAVNRDRDVQLVAESPVDFLVLSTLYAEKLQAELFLAGRRVPLDPVKDLVLLRARQIAVAWKLPGLESRVDKAWRKSTALHTLTSTRRTPFRLARRRSHEEYLADTLLTFGKLRNYCAHHDILDWKLLNTKVGAPAIEALVLTVLLTLDP